MIRTPTPPSSRRFLVAIIGTLLIYGCARATQESLGFAVRPAVGSPIGDVSLRILPTGVTRGSGRRDSRVGSPYDLVVWVRPENTIRGVRLDSLILRAPEGTRLRVIQAATMNAGRPSKGTFAASVAGSDIEWKPYAAEGFLTLSSSNGNAQGRFTAQLDTVRSRRTVNVVWAALMGI